MGLTRLQAPSTFFHILLYGICLISAVGWIGSENISVFLFQDTAFVDNHARLFLLCEVTHNRRFNSLSGELILLLGGYELIAFAVDIYNLDVGIILQQFTEFGDIDIHAPRVEVIVVFPD